MHTFPDLENAYKTLRDTGIDEDDLHDAVLNTLKTTRKIDNPTAYLARAAYNQRTMNPISLQE